MVKIWSQEHIERILGALTQVHPDAQEEVLRSAIQDFQKLVVEGDTSMESMNAMGAPMRDFRITPVDPLTFLTSKKYLGLEDELYPEVGKEFVKMNSGDYVEVVLTGAIGTAKTTLAIWTTAYQVYLLACLRNPKCTCWRAFETHNRHLGLIGHRKSCSCSSP
jgi:hypothetical protein